MKSILLFFNKLTIGKGLLLSFTPIIAMILSIETFLLALFLLLTLDLITGISKTLYQKKIKANPFKKNFWAAIKSKGFRDTCKKTYQYLLFVVTFLIVDSLVFKGYLFTVPVLGKASLSEIGTAILCFVEMWSICENLEAISGINPIRKVTALLPRPLQTIFSKEMDVTK